MNISYMGERRRVSFLCGATHPDGRGRPLEDLVQGAQFGREMADGGSTYSFVKNRLLVSGSPKNPSGDQVWAVGRASTRGYPQGQPSERLPPGHTSDPDRMLDLIDRYRADALPGQTGVGGWVGSEHDEPPRLHVDAVDLMRGKNRKDAKKAVRAMNERGEAAIYNPSIAAMKTRRPPKKRS